MAGKRGGEDERWLCGRGARDGSVLYGGELAEQNSCEDEIASAGHGEEGGEKPGLGGAMLAYKSEEWSDIGANNDGRSMAGYALDCRVRELTRTNAQSWAAR